MKTNCVTEDHWIIISCSWISWGVVDSSHKYFFQFRFGCSWNEHGRQQRKKELYTFNFSFFPCHTDSLFFLHRYSPLFRIWMGEVSWFRCCRYFFLTVVLNSVRLILTSQILQHSRAYSSLFSRIILWIGTLKTNRVRAGREWQSEDRGDGCAKLEKYLFLFLFSSPLPPSGSALAIFFARSLRSRFSEH